ncbi:hypothetical protein CRYUN_Cryun08bG0003400 [Craigia yunnanensis]
MLWVWWTSIQLQHLSDLYGQPGYQQVCNEGSRFVIWDGIHYTEAANCIITSRVLSTAESTPRTFV